MPGCNEVLPFICLRCTDTVKSCCDTTNNNMLLLRAWKLQKLIINFEATKHPISFHLGLALHWASDTWTGWSHYTIFLPGQVERYDNLQFYTERKFHQEHMVSKSYFLREMYILFYQYVPQPALIKILFNKVHTTVEFNTRCFWSVAKSSWINNDQTLLGNKRIYLTKDILTTYNARFYFTFFTTAFIARQPLKLSIHRSY